MSDRGYIIRNQYAIHFITFSVIQWIDIFTRKVYADIVIDSLKYCKANKGLKIYAWCIMSNHLHLIVSTDENYMVSDVIRDFKKFTSVSILAELKIALPKVEKIGCFGFLRKQEKVIIEIRIINFGNKIIIR